MNTLLCDALGLAEFFLREKGKTAFVEGFSLKRPFSLSRVGKSHLAGGRKSGLTN